MGVLEAAILSALVKLTTDGAKWLSEKGSVALPDVVKKIVAYVLALVGTQLAQFHVPSEIYGPILSNAEPALTSLLVAFGATIIHDTLDWVSRVAGNHPSVKPLPTPKP